MLMGNPGDGDSYFKRTGYLLGAKKVLLIPLRVFSLERYIAGAFAVLLRVLS